eukprot:363665-Chlamydomonas_euryale.AAC.5
MTHASGLSGEREVPAPSPSSQRRRFRRPNGCGQPLPRASRCCCGPLTRSADACCARRAAGASQLLTVAPPLPFGPL